METINSVENPPRDQRALLEAAGVSPKIIRTLLGDEPNLRSTNTVDDWWSVLSPDEQRRHIETMYAIYNPNRPI